MLPMSGEDPLVLDHNELLGAFWTHYRHYKHLVQAISNPVDSTVLTRLGDDVDEFLTLVTEVRLLLATIG